MPDVLDAAGLQVKTAAEIRAELEESYREIYGADINLAPDTPDGQLIGILTQLGVDVRELLALIYSSFDPDQAPGVQLDQRVILNGIARLGGSYTTTDVSITTDRALTLVGLDGAADELNPEVEDLFIVRDDVGNRFFLLATEVIGAAGTYALSFRAEEIGEVLVSPNTITTAATAKRGVTAINNPSGPSTLGVNQELDAALRVRRRRSTAISSLGYLDSIEAALANLAGVTTALVLENDTSATDSDGTLAHTIWAIVEGGTDEAIGQIIYARKSAGSGMRGAEEVAITRPNGLLYTAKFDRPVNQDLWIRFSLALPGGAVDDAAVKNQIVENIVWPVNGDARASVITAFVQGLNANYVITAMQVSDDDATYAETVSVAAPLNRFVNAVARITIT